MTGYIVNDSIYDMRLVDQKYKYGREYISIPPKIPAASIMQFVESPTMVDSDFLTSIALFGGKKVHLECLA